MPPSYWLKAKQYKLDITDLNLKYPQEGNQGEPLKLQLA